MSGLFRKRWMLTIGLLAGLIALSAASAPLSVAGGAAQSSSPVYWWWDSENSVGTSRLIRHRNGISARYSTKGLPAGQAVTLWFIVFNNPDGCSTTPCTLPDDLFNPAAEADFLWGGGQVIGAAGRATFGGYLQVGDLSGSGFPEVGFEQLAIGLTDPLGAEVHLALHSHGPAMTGETLTAQLSSYTGGCETYVGPNGFAGGPEDLPDAEGECSTIQRSIHQP